MGQGRRGFEKRGSVERHGDAKAEYGDHNELALLWGPAGQGSDGRERLIASEGEQSGAGSSGTKKRKVLGKDGLEENFNGATECGQ